MTDAYGRFMSRVNSWHWSPDLPQEYMVDGRGIGMYSGAHPGAFNIAWALVGGLTAREYRAADQLEELPLRRLTWIPAAVTMSVVLYPAGGGDPWPLFDRAQTLSLIDFTAELTDGRAAALERALEFDFRKAFLDLVPKH